MRSMLQGPGPGILGLAGWPVFQPLQPPVHHPCIAPEQASRTAAGTGAADWPGDGAAIVRATGDPAERLLSPRTTILPLGGTPAGRNLQISGLPGYGRMTFLLPAGNRVTGAEAVLPLILFGLPEYLIGSGSRGLMEWQPLAAMMLGASLLVGADHPGPGHAAAHPRDTGLHRLPAAARLVHAGIHADDPGGRRAQTLRFAPGACPMTRHGMARRWRLVLALLMSPGLQPPAHAQEAGPAFAVAFGISRDTADADDETGQTAGLATRLHAGISVNYSRKTGKGTSEHYSFGLLREHYPGVAGAGRPRADLGYKHRRDAGARQQLRFRIETRPMTRTSMSIPASAPRRPGG